jgi:hypothetical protein
MPITVIFDFVFEMFYYMLNNFTTETAKLSKGSDAKPRVKGFNGYDRRATEGTSERLYTIGY